MNKRLLLILLLPVLLVGPASHAATYNVDGRTGNDQNDGGVTAPFKTIARGLQAIKPGDTLLLVKMDEPYRESIPIKMHGKPEAPIIIDGGGATISGADPAPKQGWQDQNGAFSLAQGTQVQFLFGPGRRFEQGKSAEALGPEEWFWQAGRLFFKPAEGKKPADYDLEMSVRIAGIMTNGAGQITVRNLTAMHFYNDGFNIHNGSAPMWFENIKGLWNGDEGFSAHENCECYIRNAEFSNNYSHGIADVGISRTQYQNVIVRDNRSKGIYFIGATHSVTDAEVSGSPDQIVLSQSDGKGVPGIEGHPLGVSVSTLRNVLVKCAPGESGVVVMNKAQASLDHCLILGGQTGLRVDQGGKAHLLNTIVSGQAGVNVVSSGGFTGDYNLYFPGKFMVAGKAYGAAQVADYRVATQNDLHSYVEEPKFIGDTFVVSRASRASGTAFGPQSHGGADMGLELRGDKPEEPGVEPPGPLPEAPPAAAPAAAAPAPAPAATVEQMPEFPVASEGAAPAAVNTTTANGRVTHFYDFEQENPLGRPYPEPLRNNAGEPLRGVLELSTEQAHGGTKALRLAVQTPADPPALMRMKLFSSKLPFAKPIKAVRFWVYGDASGRQVQMRLRDRTGESFYDAPFRLDWAGWQQFTWDLDQRPPINIAGGNKNQVMDGPPMEVVIDITYPTGTSLAAPAVLFIDDLEIDVEE